MNFRELCNGIKDLCCVISVEKNSDDLGEIRIVDGSDKYINSLSTKVLGSPTTLKPFVPNSIYTEYIERNLNFEQFCYKSAVNKELLHAYAYPENIGCWLHMIYVPLEYETKDLAYCLYIMAVDQNFNSEVLSSSSSEIANKVLKTTLQLSNCANFKESLNNVMSDIRKLCNAKFSCILLLDEMLQKITVLAEDRDEASGKSDMQSYIDKGFYEIAVSWKDTLKDNNCIIVSNRHELEFIKEKNEKWYESLVRAGVDSLVLFRLKNRDNLIGYMWVSDFYDIDTIKIKEALEITTFILESEIGNYLLLKQLTTLSSIDLLTGVYNRNEMNNYMANLVKEDDDYSIGLLFIDINGLKKVNDELGHLKGDALIKKAANVLKAIFDKSRIFRAGGDEFVVVIENIGEDTIHNIINDIKLEANKKGVSLAIGYSLKKSKKEILKALKEADEAMYIDKRKYYQEL